MANASPSDAALLFAQKACVELGAEALASELDRLLNEGFAAESFFPLWDLAIGSPHEEALTLALLARSVPLAPPPGSPPALLPPLTLAAKRGSLKGCQLLLAAGADPDAWLPHHHNGPMSDASPLASAILNPKPLPQMLWLLLNAGASPEAPKGHPFAPLHMACIVQNKSVVSILLAAGADPDRKTIASPSPCELLLAFADSHPGAPQKNSKVGDILEMLAVAREARAISVSLEPSLSPVRTKPISL